MADNSTVFKNETSFRYANPGEIYAAAIVLPILCIVVVTLRFYVRSTQRASIGIDDWLTIPSLVLVVAMGISLIIGVEKKAIGYATPPPSNSSTDALLHELPRSTKTVQEIEFAMQLLSILAYGFIKLSILFFYRRLFLVSKRSLFGYLTAILIVLTIAWTIVFFFGFIFICGTHISANWGNRIQLSDYCGRRLPLSDGYLGSDLAFDVILLVLPLPTIWNLKMAMSKKAAISGVLLVGSAAVAASIARLILALQVTSGGFAAAVDENLTISTIFFWYMIEAGVALTAACLPTLRVLFAHKSLQAVLHGFRSVVSLKSLSAHRSGYSNDVDSIQSSKPPRDSFFDPGESSISTSAIGTRKDTELLNLSRPGEIRVEREVIQTRNWCYLGSEEV